MPPKLRVYLPPNADKVAALICGMLDSMPKQIRDEINYSQSGFEPETIVYLYQLYHKGGTWHVLEYIRMANEIGKRHYNHQIGLILK